MVLGQVLKKPWFYKKNFYKSYVLENNIKLNGYNNYNTYYNTIIEVQSVLD